MKLEEARERKRSLPPAERRVENLKSELSVLRDRFHATMNDLERMLALKERGVQIDEAQVAEQERQLDIWDSGIETTLEKLRELDPDA